MNIRSATRSDLPNVISLMRDFAEFEKLLKYFEITEEKLSSVMFGKNAFVQCLVVEESESLVAYGIFYPNFVTFRGQSGMYLEDLYVSPGHRGRGLGEAMLRKIAKIATKSGCERIDFVVLNWNESAIGFYQKHGAERDDVERHFKFTDLAFRELAK